MPVSVESFQTVMKKTVCAIVILWVIGFLSPGTALTEEPAKTGITVMSYNIYRGGTMRGQPLSQTVKVIQEAKADIVGVQETRSPSGVNAEELAQLLGWNYYEDRGNRVIITRYEIVEEMRDGIKVRLPSGQEVYLFNLHLPSHPYQPYQLLEIRPKWHKHTNNIEFIKTEAEAIEWAKKARGAAITALLEQINKLPDQDAPVFVVGDFNEPSHLDWTEKAAESGRHPIKVAYPASNEMTKAGFADAWRTLYPDEMEEPGYTWSPAYPFDDPTTHPDRIDFVYFRGKGVNLKETKIVGENKENADLVVSPYPSDHRAVVATFTLPKQTQFWNEIPFSPHTPPEPVGQPGSKKTVTIGLIGDSTVAEQSGWGPAFAEQFDRRTTILNYAKNGATLESLSAKLDELLQRQPDYVFIQFGHNDQKRYETTVYQDRLKSYVERIQQAGGQPVIVSSVTRRSFDAEGKIVSNLVQNEKYTYRATLTDYAEAAEAVAEELKLPFLDLHRISIAHHNEIGREVSMTYNFKEGDLTHFNREGAEAIAGLILEELTTVLPDVASYVKVSEPAE